MFAGFAYAQASYAGGQPFVLVLHPGEQTDGLFLMVRRGREEALTVRGRQAGLRIAGRQARVTKVEGE